jgi:hypothetical protein
MARMPNQANREGTIARKKPGPKPTGKGEPVVVRLQPDVIKRLDQWRARDPDVPTRPEAIRRLMHLGFKFQRQE